MHHWDKNPLLFTFPVPFMGTTVPLSTFHHRHRFKYAFTHETSASASDEIQFTPKSDSTVPQNREKPRIAIIGGGIAGVTAAASIASRFPAITSASPLEKLALTITSLSSTTKASLLDVDITIYEADPNYNNSQWKAATSLNAQSMVPSVSMHCFSQRDTLYQVMKDWMSSFLPYQSPHNLHSIPTNLMFSLPACLGLSCTWPQRLSFLSFMYHFLYTSLTSTSKSLKERGTILYQLSKANQVAFMQRIQANPSLAQQIGFQSGFLSLYRSEKEAQAVLEEAQEYGFEARILSIDQLKEMEPKLASLPIPRPMYAVLRPQDSSSHCALFIQDMIQQLVSMGVVYHVERIQSVQCSSSKDSKRRFQVETDNGRIQEYDYVVLAAGASTPILTQSLGVSCPTYPLRGWSLTLQCRDSELKSKNNDLVFNHAFSLDRMYGSSTSAHKIRLAGFGEMVGYQNVASKIQSHAPEILIQYAQALLPGQVEQDTIRVQPCFRPLSPDDIPIVGKVSKVPGSFLHTGHGTLGWTLSLATAECLGQSVEDEIRSEMDPFYVAKNSSSFLLPDGSNIHRSFLSPDRYG